MGKIVAYLRVSTDKQDLANQKLEILEYAQKNNIVIDQFIEIEISSRMSTKQRRIDELLEMLHSGDTLVLVELSRLGRSVGQVITLVDSIIKSKIRLIAIKEHISINGEHDIQSKVMITMFSLFSDIERTLISMRTKSGLEMARARGKLLGRPKGSLGESVLSGKNEIIKNELTFNVSKAAIARKLGCSRTTLVNYLRTRGLGI